MCGISGYFNFKTDGGAADVQLLERMSRLVSHRGPDDSGDFIDPASGIALAHRRLSIIDIHGGGQPIFNKNRTICVICNGEIYNYKELRRELIGKGYKFKSQSDTEVIVHAYEHYNIKAFNLFNGIFAFALWDSKSKKLFLVRDKYGVKPLYYHESKNKIIFASEIKSILADSAYTKKVDLGGIITLLRYKHTFSPGTSFAGIKKLRPGHFLEVSKNTMREHAISYGTPSIKRDIDEREAAATIEQKFKLAVKKQIMSDVPLGLSLSGGVDSGAVLAAMSEYAQRPVKSFTIGFAEDGVVSEISNAAQTAKMFHSEHFSQIIKIQDYIDYFDKYMWHLEEPIGNEAALSYYFVSKLARNNGIKVLLNGQGADELFGGYNRYLVQRYYGSICKYKDFLAGMPPIFKGNEKYSRLIYFLQGHGDIQRISHLNSIADETMIKSLFKEEYYNDISDEAEKIFAYYLENTNGYTHCEKQFRVDLYTNLVDNILLCTDKMSMASSIETRVPFLEYEFAEYIESLPEVLKIKHPYMQKYIWKKAVKNMLPQKIIRRKKIGFDTPVEKWKNKKLRELTCDYVNSSNSFSKNYLDYNNVTKIMDEHFSHKRDWKRMLFMILSVESWYRKFFSEGEIRDQ